MESKNQMKIDVLVEKVQKEDRKQAKECIRQKKDKDGKRQTEGETREVFGSEEVTQLPDHVIAERRCQNAAEEEKSMHIRQRREDEEEAGRTKKGQKKAGDKRGQFRSQQKLPRSSAKQSKPAPDR